MESLLTAHTFNTRPTKYGIGLLNGHNYNSQQLKFSARSNWKTRVSGYDW